MRMNEKIEQIHKFYKADKGIELCRKIKELDAYRHADYPDDVAVIFYDQEKEPEYCWVRCEDCQPPRFFGTLLNEPKIIEGIHKNDKVVFNLIEVKDGFLWRCSYGDIVRQSMSGLPNRPKNTTISMAPKSPIDPYPPISPK